MKLPYDHKGRFVKRFCPLCDTEFLYQGEGEWRCQGLEDDPNTGTINVICCKGFHIDGEPFMSIRFED
jgi:hypothetical protein